MIQPSLYMNYRFILLRLVQRSFLSLTARHGSTDIFLITNPYLPRGPSVVSSLLEIDAPVMTWRWRFSSEDYLSMKRLEKLTCPLSGRAPQPPFTIRGWCSHKNPSFISPSLNAFSLYFPSLTHSLLWIQRLLTCNPDSPLLDISTN